MPFRWHFTELRKAQGLTAYALAKKAGLEPSTVYKLEKKGDLTEIDTATLEKLARALGVEDPRTLLQHRWDRR